MQGAQCQMEKQTGINKNQWNLELMMNVAWKVIRQMS
jgi:hypothetical protein